MSVPAGVPADRYGQPDRSGGSGRSGRSGLRPGPVAAAIVLATVFLGWVVWAALGASAPRATGQVAGFQVRGVHQLEVAVVLSGVRGKVTCSVQALDADRTVVGVTDATARLPEDRSQVRTEVVVRTRAKAVSAVVLGCSNASG